MHHKDSLWKNKNEMNDDEKLRSRSFWQRYRWIIISIVAMLLAITFASTTIDLLLTRSSARQVLSGAPTQVVQPSSNAITPTSISTQIPTPTATAVTTVGTVLCQYDASTSFKSWMGSSQWKQINDGTLGSDGTGNGNLNSGFITWSDCKLPNANYAVEAQIQYVRSTQGGDFEFGILLHGDGDKSGYEIGLSVIHDFSCHIQGAAITVVNSDKIGICDGNIANKDYQVDNALHIYRAEVSGNTVKLFIDGRQFLETSDNTYADAGQVGLRDVYGDINVKSFKVIAL